MSLLRWKLAIKYVLRTSIDDERDTTKDKNGEIPYCFHTFHPGVTEYTNYYFGPQAWMILFIGGYLRFLLTSLKPMQIRGSLLSVHVHLILGY